jgi:hypothetical protein
MADVTQMEPVSGAISPLNGAEPPKRPRGRPRKVEKPSEPEEREEDDAGTQFTGNEDIWTKLANFTPEEWNQTICYLDRVMPRTDRKANGKPVHIQAYTAGCTREEIMREHGSGVYQLHVNVIDPAAAKSHRIHREVFTIRNIKFPPVVAPGDWIEDKVNDNWIWGAHMPATANGGSYPPGFNISDIMDKADQRALKMVEIMTPKAPPPKDDTVLTTLLNKLLDKSLAAPPPPDNSSLNFIIEELRADRKELREEIKELRNKPALEPTKGILEQLEEGMPIIDRIVAKFSTKSSKSDIWQNITEKAIDQLPDLIQLGHDFIKKPAPQPQQQRQQQQGLPAAAQAQPSTPAADLTPEQQAKQRLEWVLQKHQEHLFSIAPTIIEYFKVGDGFGLRDWYLPLHGLLNWADLRRDIPPELLTNILTAHPFLKTELSPPEALTTFFEQFFTDQDSEDEDDTPPVEQVNGVSAAQHGEAKTKRAAKGAH